MTPRRARRARRVRAPYPEPAGAPERAAASPHAVAPVVPLGEERPSRSARKRAALAAQALGVQLTQLTAAQLHALSLPEELLAALLEAQRLRSRAALARQRQYIGRLMRQIDTATVHGTLESVRGALDDKLRR